MVSVPFPTDVSTLSTAEDQADSSNCTNCRVASQPRETTTRGPDRTNQSGVAFKQLLRGQASLEK